MKIIRTKEGYILQKKNEKITLTLDEATQFNQRFEKHHEQDAEELQEETMFQLSRDAKALRNISMYRC